MLSVNVTGNFDNWALSPKGILVKTEDSQNYETIVHVHQKQKLVFKFFINGSDWTTDESYKIEFDANGNKNNYVNAEELQLEDESSSNSKEMASPSITEDEPMSAKLFEEEKSSKEELDIGYEEYFSKEEDLVSNSKDEEESSISDSKDEESSSDSKDEESLSDSKDEEVLSDSFLGAHTEEEISSIPETPSTPNFPDVFSTVSESFLSQYPIKFSVGEESSTDSRSSGLTSEAIEYHIFHQASFDHADLENVLVAESSFTEVSYVTSSSQYAFHDLSDLSGPEEHSDQGEFPDPNNGNSAITFQEDSPGPINFDCLADEPVLSSCSDYRSDEDEIDGIDDSIPGDVHGGNFDQTGVFAKIRELFNF